MSLYGIVLYGSVSKFGFAFAPTADITLHTDAKEHRGGMQNEISLQADVKKYVRYKLAPDTGMSFIDKFHTI